MFELKTVVKGEGQTLTDKQLVYGDDISISQDDPLLNEMVQNVMKEFKEPIDRVRINISMEWVLK